MTRKTDRQSEEPAAAHRESIHVDYCQFKTTRNSKAADDMSARLRKSTGHLLKALRTLMAKEKLAAYVVPSCDAHNSEYLADRDKRRHFISGFDGSAGVAVVTASRALLWTDGRYFLQAEDQLDDNWTLMKSGLAGVPNKQEWLAENMEPGQTVGVDPYLMTQTEWDSMHFELSSASVALVATTPNLVDRVWGSDQPSHPENPVVPLGLEFTGEKWEDKLAKCRVAMAKEKSDCLVLTALDDVAWLLNLRGSDIQYNPVFFAYAAVTATDVYLFLSEAQSDKRVRAHLTAESSADNLVHVRPYEDVKGFLDNYSSQEANKKKKVWFDKTASHGLVSLVPSKQRKFAVNPVSLAKAVKNSTEIEGFRRCHVRDAAALCCYFAWLEKHIGEGNITEVTGADKLESFRSEMEHYVGLSFDTISSSGPNGAVIHYKPKSETCRTLSTDELYLVDSGAQYKDGTTDVTRTLHFGTPSKHQKDCFTRVLKGQIRLAAATFPSGLTGNCLDSFARASLWEAGLDYMHGTGHGVGSYLNVHEGPSGISFRPIPDDPGIKPGMVFSDEPGYYEDGAFGIRLENLVVAVVAETPHSFGGKKYLTFESLTLVPVQQKMIDAKLLTADEVSWLNEYHGECREHVGALLREMGKKDGLNWLLRETEPMG